MNGTETKTLGWDNVRGRAMLCGIVGVLLCGGAIALNQDGFAPSYLFGYIFWLGTAVGTLGICLISNVTGGRWGQVIQRPLLASASTIPLMLILFAPIYWKMGDLYPWANPEIVAHDHIIQQKAAYLNTGFFTARFFIYFAVWTLWMLVVTRFFYAQDAKGEHGTTGAIRGFSAIGIVILVFTITFSTIDWSMSLEPHWFSTIHGFRYSVGFVLSAWSVMIITVRFLKKSNPAMDTAFNDDRVQEIGNLFFGFVNLWAYMAFAQLIIIWSGNMPEDNIWYIKRSVGGWKWIGTLLIVFHFVVPFLILLNRKSKRKMQNLVWIGLGIGFMQMLDEFWQVIPVFRPEGFEVQLVDVMAPLGIGGIWIAAFLFFLSRKPILPANQPEPERAHH